MQELLFRRDRVAGADTWEERARKKKHHTYVPPHKDATLAASRSRRAAEHRSQNDER